MTGQTSGHASSGDTLVLCGGRINVSSLPIGSNQSNAMVPVNGRPVISWILDDLLAKGIQRATIVVREQDARLQAFLARVYAERIALTVVPLHEEGTIVQSVRAGLSRTPPNGLVRIILGDTLIRDAYEGDHDFVYVGEQLESQRWCVALTGRRGCIIDFVDKQELFKPPYKAVAGYYHLHDGAHLRTCVERSVSAGERELSDVLRRYLISRPIQAVDTKEWFDFGHLDGLVDSRRRLLQPRHFNTLRINPVLNTITKLSEHTQKLQDELAWYQDIPQELKVLTPRILRCEEEDGRLEIVQEYYGYPTLAELYTFGELRPDTWVSILRRVLRIQQEFRRYPGRLGPGCVRSMYVDKTWQRVQALEMQDPYWAALLAQPEIVYNGRPLLGLAALREAIDARADRLAASTPVSIIHGDFCFSNILYDINHEIIRVIDPRGSFGASGIYGDARYDIAKLRHSVCELYDYVTADMFDLHETGGGFDAHVYAGGTPHVVAAEFDRLIASQGFDVGDIKFIEALLFVSMVPLHQGDFRRQQMFLLTGLSLLNEVLS